MRRALMMSIAFPLFCGATSTQDAMTFFNRYVELGTSFDPAITELYADDAKIRIVRSYPGGAERVIELDGNQWKLTVAQVMHVAKAKNDLATYADISVSKENDHFRIDASRYSVRKCYTDSDYYMVVAQDAGKLKIVEESFRSEAVPDC